MRTKTLFLAAAITAAGLASSMAQSNVYSLNVVGYVNVILIGDGTYNGLANPLNNTSAGGNNLTNLFAVTTGQNSDQILKWSAALNDFEDVVTPPTVVGGAWNQNTSLPVGQGFFYVKNSTGPRTNTFVGEVVQGNFTNVITGGGTYNMIGSSAPLGGSFSNSIAGLIPSGGDEILRWDEGANDFTGGAIGQPNWSGTAWNNAAGANIDVARGFFYVRQGANQNWVRTYTVP